MKRREELTPSEKEVARLVAERTYALVQHARELADEVMRAASERADRIVSRAKAEAARLGAEGGDRVLELVRARGVVLDGKITPELDPRTKAAVAIEIDTPGLSDAASKTLPGGEP